LGREDEPDMRIDLCGELCNLFSERGVEVVLREIKEGGRGTMGDLRHEVLPVLDVLGINVPQAPAWRRQRDAEEREFERELARKETEEQEWGSLPPFQPTMPPFEPRPTMPDFDTPLPYQHDGPRVGRNDPCPCGSGKKFKKCCGKK
jgi:preprotein translocase subunit SecA